jgi:hypothetical protein
MSEHSRPLHGFPCTLLPVTVAVRKLALPRPAATATTGTRDGSSSRTETDTTRTNDQTSARQVCHAHPGLLTTPLTEGCGVTETCVHVMLLDRSAFLELPVPGAMGPAHVDETNQTQQKSRAGPVLASRGNRGPGTRFGALWSCAPRAVLEFLACQAASGECNDERRTQLPPERGRIYAAHHFVRRN